MLAACEESGRVRDAFADRGWEAWSADILPTSSTRKGAVHYRGDVRELLSYDYRFDLVIAFPPCTDLSLAGARWWAEKQSDGRQQAASEFFMQMVNAPAPFVAVENPIGRMTQLYRPPDQVIEPWWFGDPYVKKTCLWLSGLPRLEADDKVTPVGRVTTGGGTWRVDKAAGRAAMSAYEDSEGRANRAKVRSKTFPGVARAFAGQWGAYVENELLGA